MTYLLQLAMKYELNDIWLLFIIAIFVFSIVIPTVLIWTHIENKFKKSKNDDNKEGILWS